MKRNYLLPIALLALSTSVCITRVEAASKMYYYCETKTGDPGKWFFTDFFQADPYDSARIAAEFTKFVRSRYGSNTQHAIGPADCYYRQSRSDVENSHDQQSRWASSNGNSVVETGWVP
jgi:hypothetical protein